MWESLSRTMALIRKEIFAILKDPRTRYALILPPILQCLIFGYAASYDLNDVPYALLDQDHSAASRELVARLDGTHVFHQVAYLVRASDVKTMIDDKMALLVIQIGQDFERNLLLSKPANIQVVAAGRNSNTGLSVHCPVCSKTSPVEKKALGTEITCPQAGCNTRLRVNSFVIQQPAQRSKNWLSKLLKK